MSDLLNREMRRALEQGGENEVPEQSERLNRMPSDPDWYERKAREEVGDPTTGRRLTGYTNAELADLESQMFEALPKWAQNELAEYRRRAELNPLSGHSGGGVNVWGDEKSMKVVRDALWIHGQQDDWRREIRHAREYAGKMEAKVRTLKDVLTMCRSRIYDDTKYSDLKEIVDRALGVSLTGDSA